MNADELAAPAAKPCRTCFAILILAGIAAVIVALWLLARFGGDTPVDYAKPEEHFKYGSTGGEHEMGFPYWIWRALPGVCAQHLPEPAHGYASLGMVFEPGKDLPVGTSKRHYQGIDRVFLNCAACHTSTVRTAKDQAPLVVSGMPAATFNIMGFEKFFFRCAADAKFRKEFILAEIERQGGDLDWLERKLVYPVAIAIMRERVLTLAGRFDWINQEPEWGPGRVDTFNSAKVLFNFPMDQLPAHELSAAGDFPSIWNQGQRKGMQLHWDGNNGKVEERNKNAAFGTGTTPPTIDLARIQRVEDWLVAEAQPPDFSRYFPIDAKRSGAGAAIYKQYCAACHGADGRKFGDPELAKRETPCVSLGAKDEDIVGHTLGKVTPIAEIGTDRRRLDSFSWELTVNLGTNYAGYPHRFCHFRKTFGYANLPLDGLWLRAPYLHNGSVPSLRDLLEPAANRPRTFYRGNDLYDPVKVGFVSDVAEENGRKYFLYDTAVPGNSNGGHQGKAYGTELSADDKAALVEYLKSF